MNCPRCGSKLQKSVLKSITWPRDHIGRLRYCAKCGRVLKTEEKVVEILACEIAPDVSEVTSG